MSSRRARSLRDVVGASFAAIALCACGSDGATENGGSAGEMRDASDAGSKETGQDTALSDGAGRADHAIADGGNDATVDVTTDVPVAPSMDAGAIADASTDAVTDGTTDATSDAISDAALDAGSDAGSDAAVGLSDLLPTGAISFFKRQSCPTGWSTFEAANGRFILPEASGDASQLNVSNGSSSFLAGEPSHTHDVIGAATTLASTSFAGLAGCCNNGPGSTDAQIFVSLAAAPANLPYVPLLICKKTDVPAPTAPPLPTGITMFFDGAVCPAGWSEFGGSQGRLLVGLPSGGLAGAQFGGSPLSANEVRTHSHVVNGTAPWLSAGIALASGCCGGGYGASGSQAFSVASTETALDLPTLTLLHCSKD